VSKKATAAGLASSTAGMSSARSPLRAFRRQFNEHIGAGCDAMPPILAGFRVNARPLSPGVIVTRTPASR
jgi:hypothetical protein